jgi:hypothetical protein
METGFYGHAFLVIVDVKYVLNVSVYSNEQRKNTKKNVYNKLFMKII